MFRIVAITAIILTISVVAMAEDDFGVWTNVTVNKTLSSKWAVEAGTEYRTIVCIAAIGVFAGAAMSNGMMDVARHGIMTPEYFSFYDVMCVFLAVMVTDIVLLDVFNTLGMPTSTTVSMVFELLGGAFAIAILKILEGTTGEKGDVLFNEILRTHDKGETWRLVQQHVCEYNEKDLRFIIDAYSRLTDAFFEEDYRTVKHITEAVHTQRRYLKRIRRREIIGLRRCDPMVAIEKNTWFFLANNSMQQMYYSMIRLSDPCYEHLSNNFSPVGGEYTKMFLSLRNQVVIIMQRTEQMLQTGDFSDGEKIRQYATTIQQSISAYRKSIFDDIQQKPLNLEAMTVFLNIIQESQEQLSAIRHLIRGMMKLRE